MVLFYRALQFEFVLAYGESPVVRGVYVLARTAENGLAGTYCLAVDSLPSSVSSDLSFASG